MYIPPYWLTPPKRHLVVWAARRWPEDAAGFRGMRLRQLRAIWHREHEREAHEAAILEAGHAE